MKEMLLPEKCKIRLGPWDMENVISLLGMQPREKNI
jgi:hypothetical protein